MKSHNQLDAPRLAPMLLADPTLAEHPQAALLSAIITGITDTSSAGFPYISQKSFETFIHKVPHLFGDGQAILCWLQRAEHLIQQDDDLKTRELDSTSRAIRVVRNMVHTASITAPPDLWLLRHVLGTHRECGLIDHLQRGNTLNPDRDAVSLDMDPNQLKIDLHFLCARGLLLRQEETYHLSGHPKAQNVFASIQPLPETWKDNVTLAVYRLLKGLAVDFPIAEWLQCHSEPINAVGWLPDYFQIELGYRLLPLILAMRVGGYSLALTQNATLRTTVPNITEGMEQIFALAGITQNGLVTDLGARVFSRGPGPFGIIEAYHPYLNQLADLLKAKNASVWVNRGTNVAASQDANRKTFQAANRALDKFCQKYRFTYNVFIEHAVGQGEATRQRYEKDGDKQCHYFGADLEEEAIAQAKKQQAKGILPKGMRFISGADIGEPQTVIDFIREYGLSTMDAVMIVGNGFHEVRNQSSEKMISIFRQYAEAGILLIFTEESALADQDLLETAWNTYHAGFRYVHEMSGQKLRPAREWKQRANRMSWAKCTRKAGYVRLDAYSHRTRTIFPFGQKHNPAISVTHFCIPGELADRLGIRSKGSPQK